MRLPTSRTDARHGDGGLTLLELLVVISVLVLITTAMPGLIARAPDHASTLRDLVASLREARARAAFGDEPVDLVVDLSARRYGIDHAGAPLPEGTELRLTTARELRHGHLPVVRFFPDGSSSGGRITVLSQGREDRIEINWLTGRISHAP